MDTVDTNQIASKQQIGETRDGEPVYEVELKGGLVLVSAVRKSGRAETLGAGSHRAIARHIAKKKEQGFKLTVLEKSTYPEEVLAPHLPNWEEVTDNIRSYERSRG